MMDFRSLIYIVTIAQEGSISRAAQKLFISQSSLSLFLKKCEGRLNCTIFQRSTRGMKLTYEGERVVDTASQMLSMWDRLKNELNDIQNEIGGRVRFGISSYRGPFVLPYVVTKIRNEFKLNIELIPTEAVSPVLEEMLLKGTLDLAILSMPIINNQLALKDVGREEIMICGQKGDPVFKKVHFNPERNCRWLDVSTLESKPMVLVQKGQGLNKLAIEVFAKQGLVPNVVFKTSNLNTAVKLAKEGIGLTLVPQLELLHNAQEDIEYASIGATGCFRRLVIAYPPNVYISGAVELVSKMVEEALILDKQAFEDND